MRKHAKLFAIILGALFVLGTAGSANADDWCAKHIRHAQHELNEAIHDHGYHSREANQRRHELDRVRDQCRYGQDRDRDRDYNGYR